jgi:hypothetical protein
LAYTDGDEFALQMDKATILGDAVTYVRELQGKVKTLEKDSVHVHGTGGTIQSTVLVKKPCRIPDSEVATSDGSNGDDLPEAAGDRGAAVGSERAAADPLRQREGTAGEGAV